MTRSETKDGRDMIDCLIGNDVKETTITDDDGNKYTGRGHSSEEANKNASEKYNKSK